MNEFPVYIFDCDGVMLDSNSVKSQAFYDVAYESYGKEAAEKLTEYNKIHGGISRYEKFKYFHQNILGLAFDKNMIAKYIEAFSSICFTKLLKCDEIIGFKEFVSNISQPCFVASGGDENELRKVLNIRKLDIFFDGIYGSPKSKEVILSNLSQNTDISNGMFFGDSKSDYLAAIKFNMNFTFVYGVTEFADWKLFFKDKNIYFIKNFLELL